MTHEPKCEKHKGFIFEGCPTDICEDIEIKVPVSVSAHSEVCDVQFKCMGHTIDDTAHKESQGSSKFNVVQKINVHIPLKFKAECEVSEGIVNFDVHDCNSCKD